MADHNKPSLTGTTYTNYTSEFHARATDAMTLDPSTTTSTNIPTGTRAWDDTAKKWRKWTGATWVDLIIDIVVTGFVKAQTGLYAGVNLANQVFISGSAATFATRLEAQGTDTDVSIVYKTKGNGQHGFWTNGTPQMVVGGPASAVNYLAVYGSATGNDLSVFAAGSDTNIGMTTTAKGTGIHKWYAAGSLQFSVTGDTASPSWLDVGATASGARVRLEAKSSLSDVDIILTPKGAGATISAGSIQLSNGTANTPEFMAYDNLNGSYGYMDMSGELLRWVTSYRGGVGTVRWGIEAQTGAWSLAGNKGTTGQVLTSQGTSAAPVWAPVALSQVKNKITNGNFIIHYMLNTNTVTATAATPATYNLNRWSAYAVGGLLHFDRVRYGSSPVYAGTSYALSIWTPSGSGCTGGRLNQRVMADEVADLAGKTVTLQAKIYKTNSGAVTWTLYTPNTEDVYSSKTVLATGTFTVSGADAVYSAQIAIPGGASPAIHKGLEVEFSFGTPPIAGDGDFFTITEIQLAVGSSASEFEFRPYAVEHLLCERYAPVWGSPINSGILGAGFYDAATTGIMFLPHRVRPGRTPSGARVVNPTQLDIYEGSSFFSTSGGSVTYALGGLDGILVRLSGLTGRTVAKAFFAQCFTGGMLIIGTGCEL